MNMGSSKTLAIVAVVGVLVVVVTVAVVLGIILTGDNDANGYRFSKAAVAADNEICSETGRDILKDGGSAVDAAIASLLCLSVVSSHSSGVGGGFFMLHYSQDLREAVIIDASEAAPAAATERMFVDQPELSLAGGLSVAVPGEFKGYWEAHQRYGVLPWKQLFEPAYNIAVDGYVISESLEKSIIAQEKYIRNDTGLSTLYLKAGGTLKLAGDIVQNLKLAETLLQISNEGIDTFYSGEIATNIASEIQEQGGIITAADLASYKVHIKMPLSIQISDNDNNQYEVLAAPPPSSGVVTQMILNVMDVYGYKPGDINSESQEILMYHSFMEACKFAFSKRAELGDSSFVDIEDILDDMTSDEFASLIRTTIDDDFVTFENVTQYGVEFLNHFDKGTSHMSVLAPNGDAVAVTSTINNGFGAKFTSPSTGIILNNQMDSFSTPGVRNSDGIAPSPANFIAPGKRPMSSQSPTVVLDQDASVRLVIGASGSSRMMTSISMVVLKTLILKQDLKKTVQERRLHHQLSPNYIQFEEDFPQNILASLLDRGHDTEASDRFAVVQSIFKSNNGDIYAYSDARKGGVAKGY